MKSILTAVAAAVALVSMSVGATAQQYWNDVCGASPASQFPFCNQTLSIDDRVADLVSRIQAADAPSNLINSMAGMTSLGIPFYQVWSEALHGVAHSPGVTFGGSTPFATSFPEPIVSAAAFNHSLWTSIGNMISEEARAFANAGHAGLTFWTPNINVIRDPRWGRAQETPGEDPYLTGEYARTFVRGMTTGSDPRYVKVAPCLKHFDAYDLEDYDGVDRHHFNAVVTSQDLADTYLPAFQAGVEEGAAPGIMCSYNEVNGVPSCANDFLLTTIARDTWAFDGYITSDCGAVDDVIANHHYTNTSDATVAAVFNAGMDTDCGSYVVQNGGKALSDGAVSLDALRSGAFTNMFRVLFRLGLFDDPAGQPYRTIPPSAINTPAHQAAALDAALQGIVLLKNTAGALPLAKSSGLKIAAVGPLANATMQMQGNYFGTAPFLISPLQGLSQYGSVSYAQGCDIDSQDTSGFAAAAAAATAADVTFLFVGLDQSQESEGHDRTSLAFPGVQSQFIAQTAAAAKGAGKTVILVLMAGGSVDLSAPAASSDVDAIFWAGYPGQAGGQAIAMLSFGDAVPAGRAVYTFYEAQYANEVSMFDMNMRPTPGVNPGRTYRFYQGTPVYDFGFGLSYTTFSYSVAAPRLAVAQAQAVLSLRLEAREQVSQRQSGSWDPAIRSSFPPRTSALAEHPGLPAVASPSRVDPSHPAQRTRDLRSRMSPMALDEVLRGMEDSIVNVTVTNTGSVDAADSVLCFLTPPGAGGDGRPLQELVGFKRIFLRAGESQNVFFPLSGREWTGVDSDGVRRVWEGEYKVTIGVGHNAVSTTTFTV